MLLILTPLAVALVGCVTVGDESRCTLGIDDWQLLIDKSFMPAISTTGQAGE